MRVGCYRSSKMQILWILHLDPHSKLSCLSTRALQYCMSISRYLVKWEPVNSHLNVMSIIFEYFFSMCWSVEVWTKFQVIFYLWISNFVCSPQSDEHMRSGFPLHSLKFSSLPEKTSVGDIETLYCITAVHALKSHMGTRMVLIKEF